MDQTLHLGLDEPEFNKAVQVNQQQLRSALKKTYDFIVCGSGSSGSVVARRLAENPAVSVLLLEAGGSDEVPEVVAASAWPANLGSSRDWGFVAKPNPRVNGRAMPMNMGKALGGGSSINAMIWSRGHKSDWDYFAEQAADPAWNYESALGIYKRIEDWQGEPDPARRGSGGLVYVQPLADRHAVGQAILDGAGALGIPSYADSNGAMMEAKGGSSLVNVRVRDGKRLSVFRTYVYPVMDRPNLTVLTNALVTRVRFDGLRATGIECLLDGREHHFNADREVVLSLGAIHTPKVLMQSGVGERDELREFGIPVVKHLPGVGKNLQDHVMAASCIWEYPTALPVYDNGAGATVFWESEHDIDCPDMQLIHAQFPLAGPDVASQYDVPAGAWSFFPALLRPRSVGKLRLTGRGPMDAIEIDANSLSDPSDLDVLVKCVQLARDLGNSTALKPFVKREVMPNDLKRESMEQFIRNSLTTLWHQCGTAKMGRDSMSVVDNTLKVYGVTNLRIADASIMPRVVAGNTMASCVVIGERAGQMLKVEHGLG
jgi:choline dehydrogenase